jgi:hypothetical protein
LLLVRKEEMDPKNLTQGCFASSDVNPICEIKTLSFSSLTKNRASYTNREGVLLTWKEKKQQSLQTCDSLEKRCESRVVPIYDDNMIIMIIKYKL